MFSLQLGVVLKTPAVLINYLVKVELSSMSSGFAHLQKYTAVFLWPPVLC